MIGNVVPPILTLTSIAQCLRAERLQFPLSELLVGAIFLPDRDKVNSDVADNLSLGQLFTDLLGQDRQVFGILMVGRELASSVDLPIKHLLMSGQDPHIAIGAQEGLARRRGLCVGGAFNKDFTHTTEGLELWIVPCPSEACGGVVRI